MVKGTFQARFFIQCIALMLLICAGLIPDRAQAVAMPDCKAIKCASGFVADPLTCQCKPTAGEDKSVGGDTCPPGYTLMQSHGQVACVPAGTGTGGGGGVCGGMFCASGFWLNTGNCTCEKQGSSSSSSGGTSSSGSCTPKTCEAGTAWNPDACKCVKQETGCTKVAIEHCLAAGGTMNEACVCKKGDNGSSSSGAASSSSSSSTSSSSSGGARQCGGQSYDPSTQGCCDCSRSTDRIYNLNTETCCGPFEAALSIANPVCVRPGTIPYGVGGMDFCLGRAGSSSSSSGAGTGSQATIYNAKGLQSVPPGYVDEQMQQLDTQLTSGAMTRQEYLAAQCDLSPNQAAYISCQEAVKLIDSSSSSGAASSSSGGKECGLQSYCTALASSSYIFDPAQCTCAPAKPCSTYTCDGGGTSIANTQSYGNGTITSCVCLTAGIGSSSGGACPDPRMVYVAASNECVYPGTSSSGAGSSSGACDPNAQNMCQMKGGIWSSVACKCTQQYYGGSTGAGGTSTTSGGGGTSTSSSSGGELTCKTGQTKVCDTPSKCYCKDGGGSSSSGGGECMQKDCPAGQVWNADSCKCTAGTGSSSSSGGDLTCPSGTVKSCPLPDECHCAPIIEREPGNGETRPCESPSKGYETCCKIKDPLYPDAWKPFSTDVSKCCAIPGGNPTALGFVTSINGSCAVSSATEQCYVGKGGSGTTTGYKSYNPAEQTCCANVAKGPTGGSSDPLEDVGYLVAKGTPCTAVQKCGWGFGYDSTKESCCNMGSGNYIVKAGVNSCSSSSSGAQGCGINSCSGMATKNGAACTCECPSSLGSNCAYPQKFSADTCSCTNNQSYNDTHRCPIQSCKSGFTMYRTSTQCGCFPSSGGGGSTSSSSSSSSGAECAIKGCKSTIYNGKTLTFALNKDTCQCECTNKQTCPKGSTWSNLICGCVQGNGGGGGASCPITSCTAPAVLAVGPTSCHCGVPSGSSSSGAGETINCGGQVVQVNCGVVYGTGAICKHARNATYPDWCPCTCPPGSNTNATCTNNYVGTVYYNSNDVTPGQCASYGRP